MDAQNVSAQLYFKQLPMDPNAGSYGCNSQGSPYETTCVNDVISDANIENAFQSQLGLSEYYKTPGVYEAMKNDFMDRTLGGEMDQTENPPMKMDISPAPPKPSKNFFNKSNFGLTGFEIAGISLGSLGFILIVAFFVVYFLIKKKNPNFI